MERVSAFGIMCLSHCLFHLIFFFGDFSSAERISVIPKVLQWNTDSAKKTSPGHKIRMYWTNIWQPTVHVQQNIFEKTLIETCSPHLYASFGAQIGQLFEAQWVFQVCFEIDKSLLSKENMADFGILPNFQRLTVPRIIDKIECCKRCQKKRKDVDYNFLLDFFQKYLFVHEQSAVKTSFSTYVWCEVDSCFCGAVHSDRVI